ncbi:hypothetical protein [Ramlibacter sp.]|uniref:hypothetical protein n=1 Tax=Ramlibacter sp. TaxID=1917967 RepID=UPI003D0B5970
MAPSRIVPATLLAIAAAAPFAASAQQLNAGQCILAGRITTGDRWAPRFEGVQLMASNGRVVTSAKKEALGDVQQVRLSRPALLAKCDGDREVARADALPHIPKEPMPAVSAGIVEVEAVNFPKLRTGGELVELRLRALPLDRVVMVKR